MLESKLKNNKLKKYLLIIFMTIISSIPIFFKSNQFVYSHDLVFHLDRIIAISDNIKIGKMIPVYYNYLNHFGYGNGLFYPDLFLYMPAFFHFCGLSIINSYKIFVFLINFFSIISIDMCIKKITYNEKSSNIGIILYATSLYRFTDMFERGAIGESLSFIFIPFIILGLYKIFYENYEDGYYLIIGLTGLLFSHVITSYMIFFLIIFIVLLNYKKLKKKEIMKTFLICIITSLLITAAFWLPLLEQLLSNKYNVDISIRIFENCVPFLTLFIDFSNRFFSVWLPSGIGIIYYFSIYLFYKFYRKSLNNKFLNDLIVLALLSIIISSFKLIWKVPIFYKLFSIIQFPWRFYVIATCVLVIATSIFLIKVKNRKYLYICIVYSVVIFCSSCLICYKGDYVNNDISQDIIMSGEYLPIELSENYNDIINNYTNKNISYSYQNEILIVDVKKNKDIIELPLIYYKGYVAKDDKESFKVFKSNNGLVKVLLDKDTKHFEVFYEGTLINKYSKYISLFGIVCFGFYVSYKLRND